mgnify:CR=1 FL=1
MKKLILALITIFYIGTFTLSAEAYVGNRNTGKIHTNTCSSVSKMSNGNKVYIGQFETVDLKAVLGREAEIREAIKALVAEKGYQFVLFFATDILAEGSQFICEGDTQFVSDVFGVNLNDGESAWMPGVLSRKKQVAAPILAA